MKHSYLFATLASGVAAGVVTQAGAQTYTAAQAEAGRASYATNCAVCHGENLQGGAGPALSGSSFAARWGTHTTSELLTLVQAAMPPGIPGVLNEAEYLEVIALMLETNGVAPGADALTAATARTFDDLIPKGAAAGAVAASTPSAPATGATTSSSITAISAPIAAPSIGVMVPGTVENFVPVTDAMLRNPKPGDWPMMRRDYDASNHSPLEQITPANVGSCSSMGVGDARSRRPRSARADRVQRRHLRQQSAERHASARRAHRHADLGKPLRPQLRTFIRCAVARIYDDKIFVATNEAHSARARRDAPARSSGKP